MYRIKHHIKKHHKTYLFGIFGGRAIFKTMILILGLFGVVNVELDNNKTYADFYTPECGATITGDVTLTSDMDCSSYAGNAINIGSSNLILDGSGYNIKGNPSYPVITINNMTNIKIKNLSISGSSIPQGIIIYNVSGLVLENLDIKNTTMNTAGYNPGAIVFLSNPSYNIKILGAEIKNFYIGVHDGVGINNLEINQSSLRRSKFDNLYLYGVYTTNPKNSLIIKNTDFNSTYYNGCIGIGGVDFGLLNHSISDLTFSNSYFALSLFNSQNLNINPLNSDFNFNYTNNIINGGIYLINNTGITIKDLSIFGITGYTLPQGIVVRGSSGLTFENLDIKNTTMNTAGYDPGAIVFLSNPSYNIKILGVETKNFYAGIYNVIGINNLEINESSLRHSKFEINHTFGAYLSNLQGILKIKNSDFKYSTYGPGLQVSNSSYIEVKNNLFSNSQYGASFSNVNELLFSENNLINNSTYNFSADTGYTLGGNYRGHTGVDNTPCFFEYGGSNTPYDTNRADILDLTGCFYNTSGRANIKSYIVGKEEDSDWLNVTLSNYKFTKLRKGIGISLNEAYDTVFNIKNNLGRATSGDRLMTPFGFRAPVPDLISSGENVTVEIKVKFFNLTGN